ncbi:class I SAM-dependent DNA methyltransferase [Radiobacillus sp. PE A8.2]|uniref:class I SAM-dependent DNA methyltransferase n=1 Tax=Radiobacillus sp. PE A8.2 TaxID=3380349 RepID=UPI00388E8028
MSYDKMAFVYDLLMEDAPYDAWVEFTEVMLEKYKKEVRNIVDLGCGTGQITRRLAASGYEIVGVDYSEAMLTQAKSESDKQQLSIQWINQDIRELVGFSDCDVVVSFCDVMNYITEENELDSVFQRVYDMLADEGLFIFDVHSLTHIENDMKDQTFAEIYDDVSYVWVCHAGQRQGEVEHDLTFFVQDAEGKYERFDETHQQRTFNEEAYRGMLKKAGFTVRDVYADFSTYPDSVTEKSERLFFVCQKNRGS